MSDRGVASTAAGASIARSGHRDPGPRREVWHIDDVRVRTGRGVATGHHGELFQGQIQDETGTLRRCLLSLPCSSLYSWVTFEPEDVPALAINPPHKVRTRAVIQLALRYLGAPGVGGTVTIDSNIPEGKGYGS